jgi:hypothetical protein
MTDSISNIIDFGEVFNQIRRSQRELIINALSEYCANTHGMECECQKQFGIINNLPYPGEVSE